ncbi:hypothetical protein SBY92_003839 [Candida maltosa Xu316]
MSFWPFTNSMNSNNALSKFLDSIQDLSSVTVDDLIGDPTISQELLNELHNIKGSYNSKNGGANFSFSQSQAANDGITMANSDSASVNSSNNDNNNSTTKDAKGTKLIELLIQPHILTGLIEYLQQSVDFFYDENIKEEEKIFKKLNETLPETDEQEEEELEEEKDEESEDEKFRRCVQTAADILSIDLWVISNRIIETPSIIDKLWSILDMNNLQENSPAVSYLVHILDQLMDTNSIELLNFIRRQKNLVDTFLTKIEVPMLMDFFFRVIQTDKPDSPTGIIDTIAQQNLVVKLIDILKPEPSQFALEKYIPNHQLFFKQTAATDFLKALVTISSNAALAVVLETNIGPNQLTRELVSPEIVNTMINDIMLVKIKDEDGKIQTNKHGINNCVSIIIELIRKNNSDYDLNCGSYSSMLQNGDGTPEVNSFVMFQWLKDFEQNPPGPRDPIYLGEMLYLFSSNLDKFAELVHTEPIPPSHVESNILGFTRFKLSELIAELLHCSNMILLNSKKIKKIIGVRDQIRSQQEKRLKKALEEQIAFPESPNINQVTSGIDDVSLDDIHFGTNNVSDESNDYKKLIDTLDQVEDSEDEEPLISPENPFVCSDRDKTIRHDPCVGDYFKIKLLDSAILLDIVTLFTKFPWNNFFHNVVFDLIQQIFNGKLNSYNSFLIVDLFREDKCNLTEIVVKSYQEEILPRPGFMGHLILISEEIVKFTSLYKPDLISPVIVTAIQSEKWTWFVNEVLLKTREVYNVVLGADDGDDTNEYGFDSSSPKKIILGDVSNHDEFVNDKSNKDNDDDAEDGDDSDFNVSKMSPSGDMTQQKMDAERDLDDDDDEDDDDGVQKDGDDDDDDDNSNELRRVPNHSNQ